MYIKRIVNAYQDEERNTKCGGYLVDIEDLRDDADVDAENRTGKRNGEHHQTHSYCYRPSALLRPVLRIPRIAGAVEFHQEPVRQDLTCVIDVAALLNVRYRATWDFLVGFLALS